MHKAAVRRLCCCLAELPFKNLDGFQGGVGVEAGVTTGAVFKLGQCFFMLAFDSGAVDFYGDDLVFGSFKIHANNS